MNKKVISGGGPQDSLDKIGCPRNTTIQDKKKRRKKQKKKKKKRILQYNRKNIRKRDEIKALRLRLS